MKNIRFLAATIIVIMVSFVSVWAQGSFTHNMPVLSAIIPVGQTTVRTAESAFTGRGTANQSLSRLVVRGNLGLGTHCMPGSGQLIVLNSRNEIVGQASVPLNSQFSNVSINLAPNQPANGTYRIAAVVTRLQPVPQGTICGVSLTGGSVLVEWR